MSDTVIRLSDVTTDTSFSVSPTPETRAAITERLDILGVKKLTFNGRIAPEGASDWTLTAKLGATVSQSCVVTLEPVTTRIDETVIRRYLSEMPEMDEGSETEMPDDETAELAPVVLDLAAVMEEALALTLPPWPRKDGLDAVEMSVTEPGKTPLTEADVKPFAALKSLKDRMDNTGGEND